jgi:hypothetical protein
VLSSGDTINYTLATTSQFSNGQYPIMLWLWELIPNYMLFQLMVF